MRHFRNLCLIIATSCLQIACLGQFSLQEGIRNFRAQNYRHAFVRLKPEAEKGIPDAEYAVGYMYYYGQGVLENRKKACFWINKAASAGQPDAVMAAKILRTPSLCHRRVGFH